MERIVEHIERLLLWHDCVIIPDFGGFVLQPVPAVCTGDEHLFVPARKEIVFNLTLTHNDGLLTESYMQEYAVAFNDARKYVKGDVADMKKNLEDNSHIRFGRMGLFVKEDDRIIFMPAGNSDELFCTSSYGLPVFYYFSLAARRRTVHNAAVPAAVSTGEDQSATNGRENRIQSGNVIYTIPVTRTFMRVFAASIAAIVIFFLISTPVTDVNSASYSASFVPQEIMPVKSPGEIVDDAFPAPEMTAHPVNIPAINEVKETVEKAYPEVKPEVTASATKSPATSSSAVKSSAVKSSVVKSPVAKSPAAQPSSSVKTPSKAVSDKYYVIIGSWKTRGQAQAHVGSLKGDVAANAGIIESDGKVRVYAQQFPDKKAAQSYLNKIRQNPNHQQAWLYKGQ